MKHIFQVTITGDGQYGKFHTTIALCDSQENAEEIALHYISKLQKPHDVDFVEIERYEINKSIESTYGITVKMWERFNKESELELRTEVVNGMRVWYGNDNDDE